MNIWAQQIADCLVLGGQLYLSESHPIVWALAEDEAIHNDILKLGFPYLAQKQPSIFIESGSYADRDVRTQANKSLEWSWGLGDVINSLIAAEMTVKHLNEHPVGFYPATPKFQKGQDGHYRLPSPLDGLFPLTFTVRAEKS